MMIVHVKINVVIMMDHASARQDILEITATHVKLVIMCQQQSMEKTHAQVISTIDIPIIHK